ncbi:NUDIX hydrolase [Candidatus Nomurabacteria bacterium]|nr:NUDIX hydrolase [Candidatus Nomurabacteria bacterium]
MEEKELQVGAKCFFKNKEGKILLMRISDTCQKLPGWWDIPGGRIEKHESTEEGLKRELKEETGIDFEKDFKIVDVQDIFPKVDNRHVIRLSFMAEMDEGLEIMLSSEHNELGWFSVDEILKMEKVDPFIIDTLNKIK